MSRAGAGGFATVYEGFDPRLEARVAIKVLADIWSGDPDIRRRFRNEAVLLRRLSTEKSVPGLVTVFDIDETEIGQPFFVMPWADRATLKDRAQGAAWPSEQVRPVVEALTQTLGHLHAQGVIHRDVKPANLLIFADQAAAPVDEVLLGPGERLVLGDFGLAKDLRDQTSSVSMVAGTEWYMAPEMYAVGGVVDHRADVFAATRLIKDLLVGNPAEPGIALAAELQAELDRGMSTEPGERHADMESWRNALYAAMERPTPSAGAASTFLPPDTGPTRLSGNPQDPQHSPPASGDVATIAPASSAPAGSGSRRTPMLVGVGLILVALIGLGVFLLGSGDSSPIDGPGTILSGETATYSLSDAEPGTVAWIDAAGERIVSDELEVTGRLPGGLTVIAIDSDGAEHERTVVVENSPEGPRIQGPRNLASGEEGLFTANVPAGQTFTWVLPSGASANGESFTYRTQSDFLVGLIAVDADGVERGDQILVRVS